MPVSQSFDKHQVYGIGPEITLPLASKKKLYGFLNLRYFWESWRSIWRATPRATFSFPVPSIPVAVSSRCRLFGVHCDD